MSAQDSAATARALGLDRPPPPRPTQEQLIAAIRRTEAWLGVLPPSRWQRLLNFLSELLRYPRGARSSGHSLPDQMAARPGAGSSPAPGLFHSDVES